MKRVVECPSCHTKLQIFDIGKKINQKCPRCDNTFAIESKKNKDKGAKTKSEKTEPLKKETDGDIDQKKIEVKPPVKSIKIKTDNKKEEKQKLNAKMPEKRNGKKESQAQKTVGTSKTSGAPKKPSAPASPKTRPAPDSAPVAEPPIAGLSGLQFLILMVLLVIVITMQFLNLKKSTSLVENQKAIYEKVK